MGRATCVRCGRTRSMKYLDTARAFGVTVHRCGARTSCAQAKRAAR